MTIVVLTVGSRSGSGPECLREREVALCCDLRRTSAVSRQAKSSEFLPTMSPTMPAPTAREADPTRAAHHDILRSANGPRVHRGGRGVGRAPQPVPWLYDGMAQLEEWGQASLLTVESA
jgi:hypothetical protein